MLNEIVLINFIDMTLDEKQMVLNWRNNKTIKQWMYNNENISLENHLSFIKSLEKATNKLYFLVKQNNNYIGVIDFTNIDINQKSAEIGLYGNVNLKGIGNTLMSSICEYGFNHLNFNTLIAEVFIDNKRAIHLYEKFNFQKVNEKMVNNKKVICMELKNENR